LSLNRNLLSVQAPSNLVLLSPMLLSCWLFYHIYWQGLIHGNRRMGGIGSDKVSASLSHALVLALTVAGLTAPTVSSTRVVT
jgi:hypothetical protein